MRNSILTRMRQLTSEIQGAYTFDKLDEFVNEFGAMYSLLMNASPSLKEKKEADKLDELVCAAINEFVGSE